MAISSSRLFHFTTKNSLINILENNFIPYYSLEKVFAGEVELAIPMVSFCDIPLSQINNHIRLYGNYAIGLTKEWGVRNKLNPVFYYNENSIVDKKIKESFRKKAMLGIKSNGISKEDLSEFKAVFTYLYFSKPYRGSNWDHNVMDFIKKRRILYHEREWRYVPEESEDKYVNFLFKETFLDKKKVHNRNESMKKHVLKFLPKDIRYIIVNSERDVADIIGRLELIYQKYNDQQKKVLFSRILTVRQIKDDF